MEHVPWLDVAESRTSVGLLGPTGCAQLFDQLQAIVVGLVRRHITKSACGPGCDRVFEGCGTPAANGDSWAHLDHESARRLQVRKHRRQQLSRRRCGVDAPGQYRTFWQVREEVLHLRYLASQHEADADQLITVKPAEGKVAPFSLHARPRRRLQERGAWLLLNKRQMFGD